MLKTLRRIVQEVNKATTVSEALQVTVQRVRKAIATQACSVYLIDERHQWYVLIAAEGLNTAAIGKTHLKFDEGLVGLVGKRGEPINLENAWLHPNYSYKSEVGEQNFRAFLGVPIIHHRKLLGVLVIQQEEARKFNETEEAFLVTLSAQLGGVFAHAEVTGTIKELSNPAKPAISPSHFQDGSMVNGIGAVPGVGIGQAVVVYPLADLDAVPDRYIEPEEQESEVDLLYSTFADVRREIETLCARLENVLSPEELALFGVYIKILDNSSFSREIINEIRAGNWGQGALKNVVKKHVQQFEAMENEYLSERAADIKDLGIRILSNLQAHQSPTIEYPDHTVLVGEELTASSLADVPEGKLIGIVSARGSINSHVAILARAIGIPAVMGAQGLNVSQLESKLIIVDGYQGQAHITPAPELMREFTLLAAESKELDKELEELRDLPTETTDGERIMLCVNTGLGIETGRSLSVGADGIGLYRTEIPFMNRNAFPAEEEQRVIYKQLLKAFAPRPVVMRTLDIGGDKTLPYFAIEEENPFLGWRGIRITLDHPEIFLVQVRAMLQASEGLNNLRIMLPMITNVGEVDEALALIRQAYNEVVNEGHNIVMPPVGVMIEVPSAVYQARDIAKRVDFLSVGSNDLTQYLLAVDRNNSRVANLYQVLHPAVLQALKQIVTSAHQEGKLVSICGEMASDPIAVIILLGMGFDCLSMNPSSLLRIKWIIRNFSAAEAKVVVKKVLAMEDAVMIRKYMEHVLDQAGLGSLIRARKW